MTRKRRKKEKRIECVWKERKWDGWQGEKCTEVRGIEAAGKMVGVWLECELTLWYPGSRFFLVHLKVGYRPTTRAQCIYVWHHHVNNSFSTSCLNYWCLKEYRTRQQKTAEGVSMMQDGEKNYDFIIIYSFIPKWVICQMKKNVTFNQINKKNILLPWK